MRGLSQGALAGRAELPPSSIGHFESGGRKPSFESLVQLADALDVSADYLLGRSESAGVGEGVDPVAQELAGLGAEDRDLVRGIVRLLAERRLQLEAGRGDGVRGPGQGDPYLAP